MAKVVMYKWSHCPYCVMAKRLFSRLGVEVEEINLDGRDEELKQLRERTKLRTVPQIFIDDKLIGGYQELAALERSGELEKLLS